MNGDFRNGLTGWSQATPAEGVLSVVNGELNNTVNAGQIATIAQIAIPTPLLDDKLYYSCKIQGNANETFNFNLR